LVVAVIAAGIVVAVGTDDGAANVVDAFARPNRSDGLGRAKDGPVWTEVAGQWLISHNLAAVAKPAMPASLVVAQLSSDAGTVSAQLEHVAAGAGLAFRYQGPNAYWKVVAAPRLLTWQICKVQNGHVTVVGNTGQFSPVDDSTTVSVRTDGRAFEVSLNGHVRKSLFDSYLVSATGAGLVATGGDATDARFARFAFAPG
jgi:hypothetical protein